MERNNAIRVVLVGVEVVVEERRNGRGVLIYFMRMAIVWLVISY